MREKAELERLAGRWGREAFVALDVETTLTDQRLCLVQVGTAEANYLIDPLAIDDLAGLGAVLESQEVIKVIHNAEFERAVLGEQGFRIENVYDTMVESQRRVGKLGGGHSLLAVARRELDRTIDKRSQTSDWTRRPLTAAQEGYAAMDVEVLVDLYALFARAAVPGRAE